MSILDKLFPERRSDPRQVLSDELVRQTNGAMRDLVHLRETKDIKQREVAERMGISRSAVAQLERYDANPTLSSLRRYALAIDALIEIGVSDGMPWAKDQLRKASLARMREKGFDDSFDAEPEHYGQRAVRERVHHAQHLAVTR